MSSSSQFGPKVWYNGELVPWDQATVHVSAHVLHYGSSVFEGIASLRVFVLMLRRMARLCSAWTLTSSA